MQVTNSSLALVPVFLYNRMRLQSRSLLKSLYFYAYWYKKWHDKHDKVVLFPLLTITQPPYKTTPVAHSW
jgi:hypothetical protein